MTFINLLRRQIAPVGVLVTSNVNNLHRRFMSRLRKYCSVRRVFIYVDVMDDVFKNVKLLWPIGTQKMNCWSIFIDSVPNFRLFICHTNL